MTNAGVLIIKIVDPDPDYLGIEIRASNPRFAGTTRIYAGLLELSELAARIEGFPNNPQDERKYEFGSTEPNIAGGYCSLFLHCIDGVGHSRIDLMLVDDDGRYEGATAEFGFPIIAAEIDNFISELREIEKAQAGEAKLSMNQSELNRR
jgi:hypothetical protein